MELGEQLNDVRYKLDISQKKIAYFEMWHSQAEAEKKAHNETMKRNQELEAEMQNIKTSVQAKLHEVNNVK